MYLVLAKGKNFFALLPLLFRRKIKILAGERNFTQNTPTKIERALFNFLYQRADWIVSNSYSQEGYILKLKPQYERKMVVITNYTDTNVYRYLGYPNNTLIRIGVFGRYSKQKNYRRFAEAVKLLKQKVNIPFIIEWYGNMRFKDLSFNPDFLTFKELVAKYSLEDVLKLNDHVKNVNELMVGFDAICLPSLYEGFSNAISEAICCGKPMLVSNVSDNSLMVKDGVNGFLFNPLDVNDIVNALVKFITLRKEQRQEMALRSREIAVKLFDKQQFLEGYMNLIES